MIKPLCVTAFLLRSAAPAMAREKVTALRGGRAMRRSTSVKCYARPFNHVVQGIFAPLGR